MDLTIIIVSWNTQSLLRTALASVARETGDLKIQTIVVDNKSKDGSPDMVRREFPWVEVVESGGNLGFAKGCNLGLKTAKAPLVLFLNPDAEALDRVFTKMVSFMNCNPKIGAICCKVLEPDGTAFGPGLQLFTNPFLELFKYIFITDWSLRVFGNLLPYPEAEKSVPITKIYGTAMLVRREALDKVGSFDERFFMYCEDVDLSRRIEAGGWGLYYLAEAAVLHLGGGASSKVPGRFSVLMMCESISKLMRKYYGPLGSFGYRVAVALGASFRILMMCAMGVIKALGMKKSFPLAAVMNKYVVSLQWAFGIRNPTIPS